MVRLNRHDMQWFNNNALPNLRIPTGSTPAAEVFTAAGVAGLARMHEAIRDRNINKIQQMIDNPNQRR